jgi:hypothetical protein
MPFYSSNSKLKRKLIAKESNQALNIGSGEEEVAQPIETFVYREPSLIDNFLFTAQFSTNIQTLTYPSKFLSYTAQLPLKIINISINQNSEKILLDKNNTEYYAYPEPSFNELFNTENYSFNWYLNGTKVFENSKTFKIPVDNHFETDNLYLELIDSENNITTSNTITISHITTPIVVDDLYNFENGISSDWTKTTNFSLFSSPSYDSQSAGSNGSRIDAILEPSSLKGGVQINEFEFYWQEKTNQSGFTTQLIDSNGNEVLALGGNNPQWEIRDGDGDNEIYRGNGYDRWIHYKTTFDWVNGEHTYHFEDMSSGTIRTGTRALSHNTNIEKFKINDNIWGSASYFWIDNIKFRYEYTPNVVTFTNVAIIQNNFSIEVDLGNSTFTSSSTGLTFQEMVENKNVLVNWYVDGVKQTENSYYYDLPSDNSLKDSSIHLEIIDSHYNLLTSNAITISEVDIQTIPP